MPRKTRAALAAAAAAAEVAEVAEGKEEEEEEEEEAPEPSPPSSPLPSPSSGASDLLLAQFEHHQRKRAVAPGEADALASRLAERLEAHGLAGALGGMQIDGEEEKGGGGAAGLQAEVEGALMGLFDGAVAAAHLDAEGRKRKGGGGGGSKQENHENDDDDDDDEKEKDPEAGRGGGDPTEAVERVLDLAAALACRPGSPAGSRAPAALLGRALALAGCPSERVRALCCSFAGMCASRLGGREEEEEEGGGDDGDGPAAAAGDALDLAGQVLLPRLTDRSQSVRLAALGAAGPVLLARGCGGGAAEVAEVAEADADADSLAAAVLLRMAHDPSPACRAAAVRSCPLTEATAPAILERVRDVRDLVRAEALGALAGGTGTAGAGTAGGATITTTTTTTGLPPLSPDQRVDILRSGLTGRCARTRAAAERLLCGTWMREARYDPARLLRTLDPVANEAVCEGVCRSIVRASEGGGEGSSSSIISSPLAGLSAPEVRAYREGVRATFAVASGDTGEDHDQDQDQEGGLLDPATALFLRVRCEEAGDGGAELLSASIPDVPALCGVVRLHLGRLVGSIRSSRPPSTGWWAHVERLVGGGGEDDAEAEAAADYEMGEAFVCLQLLKLVGCADLGEEGSRRHLVSVLRGMVRSMETPDDLVEACGRTMALAHGGSEDLFLGTVAEVVAEIEEDAEAGDGPEEQRSLRQIRVLSFLSIVLEQASGSSAHLLEAFSGSIVSAVTSDHTLVREAGVSCLGKFALFMPEAQAVAEFKPLLLKVASGKSERIEVRAQAMLAMCDLALLFDGILDEGGAAPSDGAEAEAGAGGDLSFVALLSEMLAHSNPAVVVVAAEVAAKLLFAGKLVDHPSMAAHLVAIYFDRELSDSGADDDVDEIKEIGNPVRLQQILSLFFPALSIKSKGGRKVLMNSIRPLLSIVNDRLSVKKNGRKVAVSAWPIAKMVEFVCSIVDLGEQEEAKKTAAEKEAAAEGDAGDKQGEQENDDEENEASNDPSSTLSASIAIAGFLAEQSENCGTTYLRALAKVLGGADIILEEERYDDLSTLKRSMDELAMAISDNPAIRSLETLHELLEDVESEDEDGEEEDEESVLSEFAEKMTLRNADDIDPADEEEEEENVTVEVEMDEGKPSIETGRTGRASLGQLNV